ncbi:MAG: hypothetical protein RBU37_17690 [Myxococcota bacterium]|jgi:hypothetical protein|nr:hypothetical protein [Myxococcota bacterium]
MKASEAGASARVRTFEPSVFLVGLSLFATMGACSEEEGEQPIVFELAVSGAASVDGAQASFETYAGWKVELDTALLSIGPIYFYEGEAEDGSLASLFSLPSAYACPSHAQYNKGRVLGELLRQEPVDLLVGRSELGALDGLSGRLRAAELHLHPWGEISSTPNNGASQALAQQTVLFRGQAQLGEQSIAFEAHLDIPDEGLMRVVESIDTDVELRGDGSGRVLFEVLLDQVFATVDFASLTTQEQNVYVFTADTQAYNALLRGLRSRYAYRMSWSEP